METLEMSWRTENGRLVSRWVDSEVHNPELSGLANPDERTARRLERTCKPAVSIFRMLSLLLTVHGSTK